MEYRTTMYWGAGEEAEWFKKALEAQKKEERFRGSVMNFVRYAVKYTLTHDKTLRVRPV